MVPSLIIAKPGLHIIFLVLAYFLPQTHALKEEQKKTLADTAVVVFQEGATLTGKAIVDGSKNVGKNLPVTLEIARLYPYVQPLIIAAAGVAGPIALGAVCAVAIVVPATSFLIEVSQAKDFADAYYITMRTATEVLATIFLTNPTMGSRGAIGKIDPKFQKTADDLLLSSQPGSSGNAYYNPKGDSHVVITTPQPNGSWYARGYLFDEQLNLKKVVEQCVGNQLQQDLAAATSFTASVPSAIYPSNIPTLYQENGLSYPMYYALNGLLTQTVSTISQEERVARLAHQIVSHKMTFEEVLEKTNLFKNHIPEKLDYNIAETVFNTIISDKVGGFSKRDTNNGILKLFKSVNNLEEITNVRGSWGEIEAAWLLMQDEHRLVAAEVSGKQTNGKIKTFDWHVQQLAPDTVLVNNLLIEVKNCKIGTIALVGQIAGQLEAIQVDPKFKGFGYQFMISGILTDDAREALDKLSVHYVENYAQLIDQKKATMLPHPTGGNIIYDLHFPTSLTYPGTYAFSPINNLAPEYQAYFRAHADQAFNTIPTAQPEPTQGAGTSQDEHNGQEGASNTAAFTAAMGNGPTDKQKFMSYFQPTPQTYILLGLQKSFEYASKLAQGHEYAPYPTARVASIPSGLHHQNTEKQATHEYTDSPSGGQEDISFATFKNSENIYTNNFHIPHYEFPKNTENNKFNFDRAADEQIPVRRNIEMPTREAAVKVVSGAGLVGLTTSLGGSAVTGGITLAPGSSALSLSVAISSTATLIAATAVAVAVVVALIYMYGPALWDWLFGPKKQETPLETMLSFFKKAGNQELGYWHPDRYILPKRLEYKGYKLPVWFTPEMLTTLADAPFTNFQEWLSQTTLNIIPDVRRLQFIVVDVYNKQAPHKPILKPSQLIPRRKSFTIPVRLDAIPAPRLEERLRKELNELNIWQEKFMQLSTSELVQLNFKQQTEHDTALAFIEKRLEQIVNAEAELRNWLKEKKCNHSLSEYREHLKNMDFHIKSSYKQLYLEAETILHTQEKLLIVARILEAKAAIMRSVLASQYPLLKKYQKDLAAATKPQPYIPQRLEAIKKTIAMGDNVVLDVHMYDKAYDNSLILKDLNNRDKINLAAISSSYGTPVQHQLHQELYALLLEIAKVQVQSKKSGPAWLAASYDALATVVFDGMLYNIEGRVMLGYQIVDMAYAVHAYLQGIQKKTTLDEPTKAQFYSTVQRSAKALLALLPDIARTMPRKAFQTPKNALELWRAHIKKSIHGYWERLSAARKKLDATMLTMVEPKNVFRGFLDLLDIAATERIQYENLEYTNDAGQLIESLMLRAPISMLFFEMERLVSVQ